MTFSLAYFFSRLGINFMTFFFFEIPQKNSWLVFFFEIDSGDFHDFFFRKKKLEAVKKSCENPCVDETGSHVDARRRTLAEIIYNLCEIYFRHLCMFLPILGMLYFFPGVCFLFFKTWVCFGLPGVCSDLDLWCVFFQIFCYICFFAVDFLDIFKFPVTFFIKIGKTRDRHR